MQWKITYREAELSPEQASLLHEGFAEHGASVHAPTYRRTTHSWVLATQEAELAGLLEAKLLWDWLYVDQLWVQPTKRKQGMGAALLRAAETFAAERQCTGLWLWTQSWQGEEFYRRNGYEVFTRFPHFPRGFERIGLRKFLQPVKLTTRAP